MTEHLSQDELTRMVIAATLGGEYEPPTPFAREVWESMRREVADIKARGLVVEVPSDIA